MRFPAIIFCHGLNRSRLELMERAGEAPRRGFSIEASQFVRMKAPGQSQFLWGAFQELSNSRETQY